MKYIVLTLMLVLGFTLPAAADGHSPEEKITAQAEKWAQLYARRHLDTLMTLYHPKAMLFTQGQPAFIGPDAIRDFFATGFANTKSGTIDFKIENITVFDGIATLVSLYKLDLDTGAGAPVSAVGRSMLVFKLDNTGSWLIFADMDNTAPDATADVF